MMKTNLPLWSKKIALLLAFSLTSYIGFADDNLYREAREFQRGGKYDEAIDAYKTCLIQPANEESLTKQQIVIYTEKARDICQQLPYNSGMVDVDLLHGIYLTDKGYDSTHLGIQILQEVTMLGTDVNRAKAYHQLAKTYLRDGEESMAELMLDSMYMLLSQNDTPIYIQLDYESILNHYLKTNNKQKIEQYTRMMLQEDQAQRERRLHYNLVEAIVDSQTEQQRRELQFSQLKQANQRLVFVICVALFVFTTSLIIALLFYQRRVHKKDIQQADDKLATLSQELMQTNVEKEVISQRVDEIMDDINSRQELETPTPSLLQKKGEPKFRQRFELLYPLFLPRLRERIPTITRREELLSMLIVLKRDNKEIAELLAIAPRSVLMLRHRFRQKIGIDTEHSLESFIEAFVDTQWNKKELFADNLTEFNKAYNYK